jgi:arabinosaccharide transport system substrate-binding protein
MEFPYGRAPFWILVLAALSGVAVLLTHPHGDEDRPDLVFTVFADIHERAYRDVITRFEAENNCTVQMQLVNYRALQQRLNSALLVGAEVPDVVEILIDSMGVFTKGPLEDVGFVDLTQRIHDEGLWDSVVQTRFSPWMSRGHIFALPHDVHPVALCYRRDLIDELGINVDELTTWDEFVEVGRRVTRDEDGDGVIDRYMIDFPANGDFALEVLLLQRGGGLFDADGRVIFDSEIATATICWLVEQIEGEERISFPAGWGQTLAKTMIDGLVLFYICPDWRTKQFETDVAPLAGKLAIMPLPAWEPGGRRTSTWGGTGLVISKTCRKPELAWKFAKFLYYDKAELGKRFAALNILPPLKEAWQQPELKAKRPFYSNQAIGTIYAGLAPQVPPSYVTAYTDLAKQKLQEAFSNSAIYFRKHGKEGLRTYVSGELIRCADYVRRVADRNVFLARDRQRAAGPAGGSR